jgi:predicted nucleic acid-binding protein
VILVDTSSWIHMLRRDGDPAIRARVEKALQSLATA